ETDDFVTNSIDNQRARQHNTSLHYADYVSSINTSEISDLNVHLKEQ
ncbi:25929_t:CDS:1, partial [Gigaspora rosea]